jgi:hypothetical protein
VEKSIEVHLNHHILDSTPTILQLREIWADLVSKSSRKDGRLRLDAYTWLNKAGLDIIGLAGNSIATLAIFRVVAHFELHTGFNYTFDSLHSGDETKHPIYAAFRSIVTATVRNFVFIMQFAFPLFRPIVRTLFS